LNDGCRNSQKIVVRKREVVGVVGGGRNYRRSREKKRTNRWLGCMRITSDVW
jgi:hypothetical protein